MKIFFLFYSFIWTLALPLLKSHKRLKHGIDERFLRVPYAKSKESVKKILLYAASGGEAFLACTFIQKELESSSDTSSKVYYAFSWTMEGVNTFKNFAKKNPNIILHAYYAPFDKPSLIYKALKEISPHSCYILETEIWFGLLYALKKLEIPFYFVNARMTEKSYKSLSYFKWLFKKLPPTKVYALSQADKKRFASLFNLDENNAHSIEIKENLKFEQARELLQNNEALENFSKPILLFASTREEEEELLLPIIKQLLEQDICLIICPKHRERGEFWQNNLDNALMASEHDLDIKKLHNFVGNGQKIFVWDTYGYLKKLYACADIAFVGGSLAPLGGQNFLEPLAAGLAPYVGENLKNFLWVFEDNGKVLREDLREIGLVKIVQNADDLYKAMLTELENFDNENKIIQKKATQDWFQKWLR